MTVSISKIRANSRDCNAVIPIPLTLLSVILSGWRNDDAEKQKLTASCPRADAINGEVYDEEDSFYSDNKDCCEWMVVKEVTGSSRRHPFRVHGCSDSIPLRPPRYVYCQTRVLRVCRLIVMICSVEVVCGIPHDSFYIAATETSFICAKSLSSAIRRLRLTTSQ